jgi:hypothetical protein
LIDPTERAVICYFPDRLPQLKRGAERLPVLASIRLDLTVADLFGWLKLVPLV